MPNLLSLGVVALGYLLGAVPFGYMLVRYRTGKDIRDVHSGRTGGTNAMRAAGKRIGILTGILDILKGYVAVLLATWLVPGDAWVAVLAPVAAIIGHNYSIFLIKVDKAGKLQFAGGAGGATVLGGTMGLWFPSLFIILPVGAFIYYFVGYASVTTLSAGILATVILGVRVYLGLSPWEYAIYGVVALALLAWALRPNIQRLLQGTERMHGYRARKKETRKTEKRKQRPLGRAVPRHG
ncbi:MAG: glycerol-3-phosphate acyltransferase [Anaerolineales bacterium]